LIHRIGLVILLRALALGVVVACTLTCAALRLLLLLLVLLVFLLLLLLFLFVLLVLLLLLWRLQQAQRVLKVVEGLAFAVDGRLERDRLVGRALRLLDRAIGIGHVVDGQAHLVGGGREVLGLILATATGTALLALWTLGRVGLLGERVGDRLG